MRTPVFAANWKMNVGPRDATEFMRTFLAQYAPHADRTVIIFPPALSLCAVAESTHERDDILLGVQNIFREPKGAFTGESSAPMARQAGARFALVGHSERRHVFGESECDTARKCAQAVTAGLIPMLCVGETIAERERGDTASAVLRQLDSGVSALEPPQIASMLIAYEPVWAIGTGHTASPHDAAAVHEVIRAALRDRVGDDAAHVPILYGGSVNQGNARALLAAPNVDGLLVGGASLDPTTWAQIVLT
jgi:triosephosphate isomerase